jgi:hypothetical protein
MVKRIVLGGLLVGLIGILVAGGIVRTVDKTGNVAEAREQGRGEDRGAGVDTATAGQGYGLGSSQADSQGKGRGGNGYGRDTEGSEAQRLYPNYETPPEAWMTVEGSVVQSPQSGEELVVKAADGEEVTVGTGPGYMEAQGFVLEVGEQVQVQGYLEDGELKAAQVTRLRDGDTIVLRDELGRPAWSGAGKRAAAAQLGNEDTASEPRGQGQGRRGRDEQEALSGGPGTGQAQVDEWLTMQGTVTSIDVNGLVVRTADGQEVAMANRPWWFVQDAGFVAKVGDEVELVGFYEGEEFEVGQITNATSGQIVPIREENGRPLWAGGGRRGG